MFHGLPQSFQVNIRLLRRMRELSFDILSNLLFMNNLIIRRYTYSELRTTSLNKLQIHGHTVFVHACLHALAQSTSSALVAVSLVHYAAALCLSFAHVLPLPPDGSLEEPGTAATSQNNASSYTS